jgi:hypothetical protein
MNTYPAKKVARKESSNFFLRLGIALILAAILTYIVIRAFQWGATFADQQIQHIQSINHPPIEGEMMRLRYNVCDMKSQDIVAFITDKNDPLSGYNGSVPDELRWKISNVQHTCWTSPDNLIRDFGNK